MPWIVALIAAAAIFCLGYWRGMKRAARDLAHEFRRDPGAAARALVSIAGRDQARRLIRRAHR